jgi:hypothetical protein
VWHILTPIVVEPKRSPSTTPKPAKDLDTLTILVLGMNGQPSVAAPHATPLKSPSLVPSEAVAFVDRGPSSLGVDYRGSTEELSAMWELASLSFSSRFRNALLAIDQWRRSMTLRAVAFYFQEIQCSGGSLRVNLMRLNEADYDVMQVAVNCVAEVQQARERRVQNVWKEAFTF